MSYESDVRRFIAKAERLTSSVFGSFAAKVHESVKIGSHVTAAPGQPVDTGNLRNSWILAFEGDHAEVRTNVEYARQIEDGVTARGKVIQFRSAVGGAHSVKLTIAGANLLQAVAVREMAP